MNEKHLAFKNLLCEKTNLYGFFLLMIKSLHLIFNEYHLYFLTVVITEGTINEETK